MLFGVGMCTLGPLIALKPLLQEHFQQRNAQAEQGAGGALAAKPAEDAPYDRTRVPSARVRCGDAGLRAGSELHAPSAASALDSRA